MHPYKKIGQMHGTPAKPFRQNAEEAQAQTGDERSSEDLIVVVCENKNR
jgi:hypothetical protein